MNVQEMLERLSVGELSNLSMSDDGSGQIEEKRQAKLITYANDGLTRLYSRFVLSEKSLLIRLIEGVTNYHLLSRFAESRNDPNSLDPVYIIDQLQPFEDDVIKIMEVHDEYGQRVPLNDTEDKHSMFTPQFNLLQVPRPIQDYILSVQYQAKHRKLEPGVMETDIVLPTVLEEPLLDYIASKVYSHMNGPENSAKGQEYRQKFEDHCKDVVDRDLVSNTPATTSEIFKIRGFV